MKGLHPRRKKDRLYSFPTEDIQETHCGQGLLPRENILKKEWLLTPALRGIQKTTK